MSEINSILNSIASGDPRNPVTKEQLCNAFKQGTVHLPRLRRIGGGGNCASVAVIKAAIGTLGIDNVFKSVIVDQRNSRYIIDLRDEDAAMYHLSFGDYEVGARGSAFELTGNDTISRELFEFARFCFAVMAEVKRKEYRINRKYTRAVADLNKGESAYYIHSYLGLKATDVKDVSILNLSSLKNLIVWNNPHAVYSSEGVYDEFFEKHESIEPLSRLQEIHGDGSNEDRPVGAQIVS